tara:strand:- start:190 stop:993 length:804 start_codon:yes stop_codon:yes gene_type:complete
MNKQFLFTIFVFLMFASCRSTKTTKTLYTKAPKAETLIESVESAHFKFNWMSAKVSGKFSDSNQSFSFKGNMKIRKDSLIWISISPGLGLELGRVLLDLDSVHFINRFEKTYFKSSYAELSEKTKSPLSFMSLQSLLVGNAMSNFKSKKHYSWLENQTFKLSSASEKQIKKWIRNKRKPSHEIYLASINPKTSKVYSQKFKNLKLNRELNVEYEDFEMHDDLFIAESVNLSIITNKEISLSLSYSKINLNKAFKFPFSVPESYEVIH